MITSHLIGMRESQVLPLFLYLTEIRQKEFLSTSQDPIVHIPKGELARETIYKPLGGQAKKEGQDQLLESLPLKCVQTQKKISSKSLL